MSSIIKMDIKEEHICRLCLKVAKEDFEIDDIIRQMLGILFLKLDLDITSESIICQDCMEVSKKCLHFKSTCIDTEEIILSYSVDRRKVKYDIKVIYEEREHVQTVFDKDFNVCRFCITRLEGINNFASLDALMDENMFEMLSEYMAEMDFTTIENPVICANCKENLDGYFKFVQNCLDMEGKIKMYCIEKGTDNMGQVKLSNVLLFMFTDISNIGNGISDIEINEHAMCTDTTKQRRYGKSELTNNSYSLEVDMYKHKLNKSEVKRVLKNNSSTYKMALEQKQKHKVIKHMLTLKDTLDLGNNISTDKNICPMYKCSLCTFETKHKRNLNTHMLVHMNISQIKMYKCSFCTYETKYKSDLNRHMLVHMNISEIKMYKCSLCAYETKRKSNLNSHMSVHMARVPKIKTYKCSLCVYATDHKSHLDRHMLVHKDVSEIEMYQCFLCTFEAKEKSTLMRHMLVHKDSSQVIMYKCSLCAYETKCKGALAKHMLIHKNVSEIKMYKCALCTNEFKRKGTLRAHMLVHMDVSEIKMHKCSLCTFETKRKGDLNKHSTSVHKYFISKDI